MRRRFRNVVDRNQHRDLRIVHRRDADEGRSIARFGIALFGQNFRGCGFAADAVAGNIGVFARAARYNRFHGLAHVGRSLFRDDLADNRGLSGRFDRTIRIQHLFDDIRLLELAVVHDRADHIQLLQRGDGEALAERCGRQRNLVPLTRHVGVVENALCLVRQIDAGLRQHAERLGVFVEPVLADLLRNLHHCHVARVHQRFGERLRAVAARVRAADRLRPVADHQRTAAVIGVILMRQAEVIGGCNRHQLIG